MASLDPYANLRSLPATPSDEICSCAMQRPLLLQSSLRANPLACAGCNLEISPDQLGISPELAQALAAWRTFHDCFYLLWLDSREFETWAADQLSSPRSAVNSRGLALRSELERVRQTYFRWFQPAGSPDFTPAASCPICQGELLDVGLVGMVCNHCFVLVAR